MPASGTYWIEVEPLTPTSDEGEDSSSAGKSGSEDCHSDFHDSGIFDSGDEKAADYIESDLRNCDPSSKRSELKERSYNPDVKMCTGDIAHSPEISHCLNKFKQEEKLNLNHFRYVKGTHQNTISDDQRALLHEFRAIHQSEAVHHEQTTRVQSNPVLRGKPFLTDLSNVMLLDSSQYLKTSVVLENPFVSFGIFSPSGGKELSGKTSYVSSPKGVASVRRIESSKSIRKQLKPQKAPARHDPSFRGVLIKFRIRRSRRFRFTLQHRLVIKARYSCQRRGRRCRQHRHYTRPVYGESASSDEDSDNEVCPPKLDHVYGAKQCASCTTRKTPLWRDAEDGTPLCNACGIRYKKYRIRCVSCWYVPRKANKSYPVCLNCGDRVQPTNIVRRIAALALDRRV